MPVFKSSNEFIDFGRNAYEKVSQTCHSFFNRTSRWSFSTTKTEENRICDASINMFNTKTSSLNSEIREGVANAQKYLNGKRVDEMPASRMLGNLFANTAVTDAFHCSNDVSPFPVLANGFCPTISNSSAVQECVRDMYSYDQSLKELCSGYVSFNANEFANSSSNASTQISNLALFFVAAHVISQVLHQLTASWSRQKLETDKVHESPRRRP